VDVSEEFLIKTHILVFLQIRDRAEKIYVKKILPGTSKDFFLLVKGLSYFNRSAKQITD